VTNYLVLEDRIFVTGREGEGKLPLSLKDVTKLTTSRT